MCGRADTEQAVINDCGILSRSPCHCCPLLSNTVVTALMMTVCFTVSGAALCKCLGALGQLTCFSDFQRYNKYPSSTENTLVQFFMHSCCLFHILVKMKTCADTGGSVHIFTPKIKKPLKSTDFFIQIYSINLGHRGSAMRFDSINSFSLSVALNLSDSTICLVMRWALCVN